MIFDAILGDSGGSPETKALQSLHSPRVRNGLIHRLLLHTHLIIKEITLCVYIRGGMRTRIYICTYMHIGNELYCFI